MKNLLIILLVSLSLIAKSSDIGNVIYGLYLGGLTSWVTYKAYEGNYYRADNGLYASFSTDLKMFAELHLDNQVKFGYKYNRTYLHSEFESCVWAELEAITGGIDYIVFNRKLAVFVGGMSGVIFNQDKVSWTYGSEFEVRLWSKGNYSFSYCGNLITRSELTDPPFRILGHGVAYNGYVQFNIKINKNYEKVCNGNSRALTRRINRASRGH
jgi:hypothetical protein